MDVISVDRDEFKDLAIEILQDGNILRFQAMGDSMRPFIRHGDLLEVEPLGEGVIKPGDVVLCNLGNGLLVAHRIIKIRKHTGQESLMLQGDGRLKPDGWVPKKNALGRVVALERKGRRYQATIVFDV